jgi:hypothetical protein
MPFSKYELPNPSIRLHIAAMRKTMDDGQRYGNASVTIPQTISRSWLTIAWRRCAA